MGARRSYAQLPSKSERLEGPPASRNTQNNRTPAKLVIEEEGSGRKSFRYANPNETPGSLKDS